MRLVSTVSAAVVFALLWPAIFLAQSPQSAPTISEPRLINISGTFRPADGQALAPVQQSPSPSTPRRPAAPRSGRRRNGSPWMPRDAIRVLLGATQPDGVPLDVFASGQAQWLGITFDRPGDVEGAADAHHQRAVCAARGGCGHARRPPGVGLRADADQERPGDDQRGVNDGHCRDHRESAQCRAAGHAECPRQIRQRRRSRPLRGVRSEWPASASTPGRRCRWTTCTSGSPTRSARLPAWPCRICPTTPTRPPGCCSTTTTARHSVPGLQQYEPWLCHQQRRHERLHQLRNWQRLPLLRAERREHRLEHVPASGLAADREEGQH